MESTQIIGSIVLLRCGPRGIRANKKRTPEKSESMPGLSDSEVAVSCLQYAHRILLMYLLIKMILLCGDSGHRYDYCCCEDYPVYV